MNPNAPISPKAVLPSEPQVRSSAWLAANLKCKNGDTLKDLNERFAAADAKLIIAREKLKAAEEVIKPLKESVESAVSEKMNLSCRLNIWWKENRKKYEAANGQLRRANP